MLDAIICLLALALLSICAHFFWKVLSTPVFTIHKPGHSRAGLRLAKYYKVAALGLCMVVLSVSMVRSIWTLFTQL